MNEIKAIILEKEIANVNIIEKSIATVNLIASSGSLVSRPEPGKFRVVNIFVNEQGRVVVKYDDTPTP